MVTEKRCTKCGEVKQFSEFSKSKRHKDGMSYRCKTCKAKYYQEHKVDIAKQRAQYYQEHKSEYAKYQIRWREENREKLEIYQQKPYAKRGKRAATIMRRSSIRAGKISANMIKEIINASNGICPYCGEPFTDGHIDHITPLSRGGKNIRENLVYCCAHCNLVKHDKILPEFIEYFNSLKDSE